MSHLTFSRLVTVSRSVFLYNLYILPELVTWIYMKQLFSICDMDFVTLVFISVAVELNLSESTSQSSRDRDFYATELVLSIWTYDNV